LIDLETKDLMDMGVLEVAGMVKQAAPRSSYARRGLYRNVEKRNELVVKQMQNVAAAAVRQGNQQTYPFTVCARSVAMLMRRSTTFDWDEMFTQRLVLSKPTAHKLAKLMMQCKPPVNFTPMPAFSFHIFDQCYKKKGATRGEHKAAERVDASGDLVDLISMVIVNSMTMHVPDTLAGGLSPALQLSLIKNGPYTQPLASVYPVLNPDRVKASLYDMMRETGGWITSVGDRFGFKDPSEHMVASVARALAGRPNLVTMKSPLNCNKPILNCDTRRHEDGLRIVGFLETKAGRPDGVLVLMGDGQSMMTCLIQTLPLDHEWPTRILTAHMSILVVQVDVLQEAMARSLQARAHHVWQLSRIWTLPLRRSAIVP
jgi:hypothetical protein